MRFRSAKRLALEPLEPRHLLAADLELVSVTLTNALGQITGETPVVGEKVYAVAHYRITDLSPSDSYNIRWEMDGVATSQFNFTGFAGTNVDLWWYHGGWIAPAGGSHVVTVTVDSDGTVAEADEGNNSLSSAPFTALAPTSLPNKFVMPIAGVQNQDFVIGGYVDVNPQGWLDDADHFEDFAGATSTTRDFHNGIDVALPNFAAQDAGVPVLASAAGTVVAVQDGRFDRETQLTFGDAGNYVFIDHGNGWVSQYFHFRRDTITVKVGEVVAAGQTLGLVGSSGNSGGPHVHFEVQHNGSPVDLYAAATDYWASPPPYVFDPALETTIIDFGVTNQAPTWEQIREKVSDIDEFVAGTWVYAYATFASVRAGDTWKAQLYRPDGSLVNDFGPGEFLEDRPTEWSWYLPGAVEDIPGTWRVDFLYNDVKLAERTFTVGAGAPEIRVYEDPEGANNFVIDGRQTPFDFGSIDFGDPSTPTRTFKVENHGDAPLVVSAINLPRGLSIVEPLDASIPAGGSDTFTVINDPAKAGRKDGVIEIVTNDASESSFTFLVEGFVNPPVYFVATNAAGGTELWRTNFTPGGTAQVKNIRAGSFGSNPQHLTLVDGTLYFVANDGSTGYELWKSDGSPGGTTRVRDIRPGAVGSNPTDLIEVGGILYFLADNGVAGRELWRSDGAVAGTWQVKNLGPGAADGVASSTHPKQPALVEVDGVLYFAADNGLKGRELWKSDGTTAGTVLVKDVAVGGDSSSPGDLVNLDGTLYFTATTASGFSLWKSDGTAAGTTQVRALQTAPGLSRIFPTVAAGRLFFTAADASFGTELWTSDPGVPGFAGTRRVKDINPGAASSLPESAPAEAAEMNGKLYFAAANPVGGFELWVSDGTPAGTVRVKDIYVGAEGSSPTGLTNVNGTLYFAATKFNPPAPQTPAVTTLRTHADEHGLRVGAMILDPTWNTAQQQAFVASQFNAATIGTYWLRTRPSADAYDWSLTDAAVAWAASEGLAIHLHPLLYPANQHNPAWVLGSDPADALAMLQQHITTAMDRYRAGGARNPTASVVWDVVNEAVGPNGQYRDSWWLQALPPTEDSPVPEYVIKAFEFARAADPQATLVYNDHDIELSNSYHTGKWLRVQEIVSELAARGLVDGVGWQLHVTPDEVLGDSFVLQERMAWVRSLGLKNFVTELDMPLGVGDDALDRQADAYQRVAEVWLAEHNGGWLQTWGVFDGYSWLGSHAQALLFDHNYQPKPAYDRLMSTLASLGGGLPDPIPASAPTGPGRELWMSDGTTVGTVIVKNIATGADSSSPLELTNAAGRLLFTAQNAAKGRELWTSDPGAPGPAGTKQIKDIMVGAGASNPTEITAAAPASSIIVTIASSSSTPAFTASLASTWDPLLGAGGLIPMAPPTFGGDFDLNSQVDGMGVLIWQRYLGATNAVQSPGDANGDARVDAADLDVWKDAFGESLGVAASGTADMSAIDAVFAAGDFASLMSSAAAPTRSRPPRRIRF